MNQQEGQVIVSLTDSLKMMMDHYRKTMTHDEYDRFLMRVYDGISFYREQFGKIPKGYNRAYNIHRFIDELIAEEKRKESSDWSKMTCKRGCSACCYKTVILTEDEADLLIEFCKDEGLHIDVEHLRRQAGFKGSADQWFDQDKSVAKCVFLKDGECSVYEHRPTACRKFFVISEPEKCGGKSGNEVLALIGLNIELAASGAMDIDHSRVGDLPDVLLKRLEAKNGTVREQDLLPSDARGSRHGLRRVEPIDRTRIE